MTRIYLSIVEIMAIHDDQIAVYGGSGGLRDPGHLEAAILRPQSGYYQNILEEAAALWESLSQNHPFIDGNKRTALAATTTFLHVNDYVFQPHQSDTIAFVINLYDSGTFSFEHLEPWLREHAKPR